MFGSFYLNGIFCNFQVILIYCTDMKMKKLAYIYQVCTTPHLCLFDHPSAKILEVSYLLGDIMSSPLRTDIYVSGR